MEVWGNVGGGPIQDFGKEVIPLKHKSEHVVVHVLKSSQCLQLYIE